MDKINLKNLDRWSLVMPGTGVEFDRPEVRTVRIELNAEMPAAISIVRDGGDVQYLCTASGLTLVEFAEGGRFEIIADAPVWMYSAEFEKLTFTVPDPVIFTAIAQRRARNPELEYMMSVMQKNMDKRFAQLDHERERLESHVRHLEAERANNSRAPANEPNPAVSGTDDGSGEPASDAGPAPVPAAG